MGIRVAVSCTVLYTLLDVVVTTVIYTHGSHLSIFKKDALNFNILQSALDLWGTVLLRASLLLGASIGVSWNRKDGPPRVAKLTTLIVLLCLIVATYALAKMLMLSELGPLSHQPWILSLICWTCASSLGVLLLWRLLGKESNSASSHYNSSSSSSGGERGSQDTDKLVETAGEEEQEVGCERRKKEKKEEEEGSQEKEKTSSGATLGRLLLYCRKDGGLLSVAVLFLIISAVCEAFIPYYYGKAIDSIVVDQSMEHFAKPVITLSVLAVASFRVALVINNRPHPKGPHHITPPRTPQPRWAPPPQPSAHPPPCTTTPTLTSTTLPWGTPSQHPEWCLQGFLSGVPSPEHHSDNYKEMWISELALEVAILYYGGHLVITGQMSSGSLISFFIYMLELGECLQNIASVYTGLMQGVGAAEKVFEYLDREPKHPADGTEAPDTCTGVVEFKDIKFAYPTRPETEILKGVSFTLRPGEVTALVGPSGSGKSSCVSLLENFYLPQQGQVLLDGKPIHTFQHDYLHSKVALVGQEPVLFARTVEENITYGLTDVPMETVVQAAIEANAHDFITSLSTGYGTNVGEKGTQLSGGQKQRVAIARALIRNPRVLILDEATSALDAESEHIVQKALNNIMQERTVLVIAHRLSTVEKADNIIVIDRGHVAEQGSHSQLIASGGLYYKLVQRQVLGIETGAEVLNKPEKLSWKSDGGRQRRRQSSSGSGSESEHNLRY
ncbi:ATP-binding cassette sub-family B member 9-like [Perca fluviatilis]|uniref:ATP-binding cassette sub-family B member 9-like n=1 Tax=Perca fluviatilis TaxID=8168 RepID=UPI001962CA9B|nr:ATP-binding cassette sub-family B member 9-like [Perca fluviatilis]